MLDYYQLSSNRFEFTKHRFGSQVLKTAFFGTLGAPVNKQMS